MNASRSPGQKAIDSKAAEILSRGDNVVRHIRNSAKNALNDFHVSMKEWQEKLLATITPENMKDMSTSVAEKLLDHQAEIDETISQIDVSDLVPDALDVDSIIAEVPKMHGDKEPKAKDPELWKLEDVPRILVNTSPWLSPSRKPI